MKANGDLKLIKDLDLQVALNRHYSKAKFADLAANTELKRITQSRKDFIHHSGLFGLKDPYSIGEMLAERILKNIEMHTIIYDSRQVVSTALDMMHQREENSELLIKRIDEYLKNQ